MKKLSLCAALLASGTLMADTSPVMVSLVTPAQFPSPETDVSGLRFDLIYGVGHNFSGIDLGVANHTRGDFVGAGLGFVNIVEGRISGGHLGFVNWNANDAASGSVGFQSAFVNRAGSLCGWQNGFVNLTVDDFSGLQSGFVCATERLRGVQLGFLNAAGEARGIQCLGLANIVTDVLNGCARHGIHDWTTIKANLRDEVSKMMYGRTKRSPMVLPIIMDI